jgi:hypothetical protein
MARLLGLAVWLFLLFPAPFAHADTGCTFVLGFAAMAAAAPQVGRCLDGETHNPVNGDAVQHTTGGLLVWRKLDNWTAFTDGARTWVAGPFGLQTRLNGERFDWEAQETAFTGVNAAYVIVPNDGRGAQPGCRTAADAVDGISIFGQEAHYIGRCVSVLAVIPADPAQVEPSDPRAFVMRWNYSGQQTVLTYQLDMSALPNPGVVENTLYHTALLGTVKDGGVASITGVLTGVAGTTLAIRPLLIQPGAGTCVFAAPGFSLQPAC